MSLRTFQWQFVPVTSEWPPLLSKWCKKLHFFGEEMYPQVWIHLSGSTRLTPFWEIREEHDSTRCLNSQYGSRRCPTNRFASPFQKPSPIRLPWCMGLFPNIYTASQVWNVGDILLWQQWVSRANKSFIYKVLFSIKLKVDYDLQLMIIRSHQFKQTSRVLTGTLLILNTVLLKS